MRNFGLSAITALALGAVLSASCDYLGGDKEKGTIQIHFARGQFQTKATTEIPDSNDFILNVKDASGKAIFNDKFGNMEEQLVVSSGTYYISVRSGTMDKPSFSTPVYGDDQCVVVPPGGVENVDLVCSQVNSGVRLKVESDFLTSFPKGVLFLKSTEGKLMYSYSEKRIAYFSPGEVSLLLDDDGTQSNLLTRSLEPKEILTVGISAPASDSGTEGIGNIRISIDTTRIWTGADVVIGGDSGGSDLDNALDIATAKKSVGQEDVWVYGYIVGAFKSTSHIVFESPFPSSTNLAIASKTSASTNDSCFSVELKKGDMRDELNLVDNPDNRGRKVFLKGDIVEAYYGIPGIKNVTDFVLK